MLVRSSAELKQDTRNLQVQKYIAEFRREAREAARDKAKADAESEVHQQELEVLKKEWMASLRKQVEGEIRPKLADQVLPEWLAKLASSVTCYAS